MKRCSTVCCILLLISPVLCAESDQEILETVRVNATRLYLEQASWTLPESFHESGLAPSDKQRLLEQWASASADCLVKALAQYADSTDVPPSKIVDDDGSFSLNGNGAGSEYNLNLETCIELAWQAVGASLR